VPDAIWQVSPAVITAAHCEIVWKGVEAESPLLLELPVDPLT
jgi:hypothetical protein